MRSAYYSVFYGYLTEIVRKFFLVLLVLGLSACGGSGGGGGDNPADRDLGELETAALQTDNAKKFAEPKHREHFTDEWLGEKGRLKK